MKTLSVLALCLAIAPAHAGPERSPYQRQSPGAVCQPTTPVDARYVNYLEGAVTVDKPASVTCALPPVGPGYKQVGAYVTYWDGTPAWGKQACTFHNGFPSSSRSAPIEEVSAGSPVGEAAFPTDKAGFVAHAAVCTVLPGQMLYGVSVDLSPW